MYPLVSSIGFQSWSAYESIAVLEQVNLIGIAQRGYIGDAGLKASTFIM